MDNGIDLMHCLWTFRELARYGLVEIVIGGNDITIILLQELLNSVENDFQVSDYFLTMNAVGTVVNGNMVFDRGSVFQSAASNFGNISQQNIQAVTDQLSADLGQDILAGNQKLQDAIEALRESVEADRESKVGRVISELGRCIQHGANATVLLPALVNFLQNIA